MWEVALLQHKVNSLRSQLQHALMLVTAAENQVREAGKPEVEMRTAEVEQTEAKQTYYEVCSQLAKQIDEVWDKFHPEEDELKADTEL